MMTFTSLEPNYMGKIGTICSAKIAAEKYTIFCIYVAGFLGTEWHIKKCFIVAVCVCALARSRNRECLFSLPLSTVGCLAGVVWCVVIALTIPSLVCMRFRWLAIVMRLLLLLLLVFISCLSFCYATHTLATTQHIWYFTSYTSTEYLIVNALYARVYALCVNVSLCVCVCVLLFKPTHAHNPPNHP